MSASERGLLPPLACDTHSHVYGDLQLFPVRAGHAVQERAGLGDYLEISRGLGVQRHVLVQAQAYGIDTRCLMQAIASIGVECARGIVFADAPLKAGDLARLHTQGIRGMRFLNGPDRIVDPVAILATASLIAPMQWSILVQAPLTMLSASFEALTQADCAVVIDHMGRVPYDVDIHDDAFQELLRFLRGGGWIKLSAPYYGVENAVSDFGALRSRLDAFFEAAEDRVIWGMNWPHPNLQERHKPDDHATLRTLLEVLPDSATRKALFVDNPARLYGFENT